MPSTFKDASRRRKLLFVRNKKAIIVIFSAIKGKRCGFLHAAVPSIILITLFNHEQLLGYMHFGVLTEHTAARRGIRNP